MLYFGRNQWALSLENLRIWSRGSTLCLNVFSISNRLSARMNLKNNCEKVSIFHIVVVNFNNVQSVYEITFLSSQFHVHLIFLSQELTSEIRVWKMYVTPTMIGQNPARKVSDIMRTYRICAAQGYQNAEHDFFYICLYPLPIV